jgi:rubredoxin
MTVRCALCGLVYEPEAASCASCPMARGCRVVRCPRCGYAVPEESSLVRLWRRITRRKVTERGEP